MKNNPKYPGCWYCDNILDYRHQVGLLHLGFPRCFVLMKSDADFFWCKDFDTWMANVAEVNWLDPSDPGTPEEQQQVLTRLWNFAIEAEQMEEAIYMEEHDEEEF